MQAMIFATFLIASAVAGMEPDPMSRLDAFAPGYSVLTYGNDERCLHMVTHVGLDASQLARALKGGYDHSRGIDVLTAPDTPRRCAKEAKRVAHKAGFKKVRVRLKTDSDK